MQVELPADPPWQTLRARTVELNIYLVDQWRGEPGNIAMEEHDDIRWFAADDLTSLDLAHPSYADILRQAANPIG